MKIRLFRSMWISAFLIFTFLISCEAYETSNVTKNQSATTKESNLEKLKLDSEFNSMFSMFQDKLLGIVQAQRGELENQFLFTINGSTVKIIENDSIKSYTFLIVRDNDSIGNHFDNLILQVHKSSSDIDAVIITYVPSEPLRGTQHDSFLFTGTKTVTPIIMSGRIFYTSGCMHVATNMCCDTSPTYLPQYQVDHVAGSNCNGSCTYTVVQSYCNDIGMGGGFSAGALESGGGGGGAPPMTTSPIRPQLSTPLTPCEKLKYLYNAGIPKIKDRINALKPFALLAGNERGFKIDYSTTAASPTITTAEIFPVPGGNPDRLGIPTGDQTIGGGHCHASHMGWFPSWDDINTTRNLYNLASEPNGQPLSVNYLVVKDPLSSTGTLTYALMVDDLVALSAWLEADLAKAPPSYNTIQKQEWCQINIDDARYTQMPGGSSLLNFMTRYSIGFSLYELKPSGIWNKLTLNTMSGGSIVATPCP